MPYEMRCCTKIAALKTLRGNLEKIRLRWHGDFGTVLFGTVPV